MAQRALDALPQLLAPLKHGVAPGFSPRLCCQRLPQLAGYCSVRMVLERDQKPKAEAGTRVAPCQGAPPAREYLLIILK